MFKQIDLLGHCGDQAQQRRDAAERKSREGEEAGN